MIPTDARQKFNAHKQDAKRRGIEFLFTLEDWWAWWQVDSRWSNRGRGKGLFVMARYGDAGPYSPDNVRCTTYEENNAEVDGGKRSRSITKFHADRKARGILPNLAVRGAGHPQARPVLTPVGRFESGALAADHYGVTKEAIYYRISKGFDGYSWDENKPRQGKPQKTGSENG